MHDLRRQGWDVAALYRRRARVRWATLTAAALPWLSSCASRDGTLDPGGLGRSPG